MALPPNIMTTNISGYTVGSHTPTPSYPPPPPHTHTQTLVSHYDSQEHELYTEVKNAEEQRKKQSQAVQTMSQELESLKQTNARKLKVGLYHYIPYCYYY